MIGPVLDALSHLTLELKQARDEVLRLCCVCFHFLVYYGFSGCKDTHYFLNVKVFPLKTTKKTRACLILTHPRRVWSLLRSCRNAPPPFKGARGFPKTPAGKKHIETPQCDVSTIFMREWQISLPLACGIGNSASLRTA